MLSVCSAWAGPIALLFTYSLFNSGFQLRWAHALHFVPGLAGVVIAVLGQWIVYRIFTVHLFVYLVICTTWLFNNRAALASDDDAWRATGHARLFSPVRKQKAVVELYRDVGRRIQHMFDEEHVYVDPTLNVTKLAQMLKVPPYVVSRTVNGSLNKTFSELLTSYRLRHAEELLISAGDNYTVEGIAFESGFNTTTSFYPAFRKQHDMTPVQFRASLTKTKTLKHE